MTLPPALAQSAPLQTEPVAEERVIFLPAPERADRVLLGEQALSVFADRQRTPYIEQLTAAGVHIRLTDWVGHLTFRLIGERSVTEHAVTVYPAKLARDPEQAFAALESMLAGVGEWERRLGLAPQGDVPGTLSGSGASAAEVLRLGEEAWRLGQAARRLAGPPGPRERRIAGGAVPDRLDWARTLELWGRGAPGEHAALDSPRSQPQPQPPRAAPALLELWSALTRAAQTLPEGEERRDLLGRLSLARARLGLPVGLPGGSGGSVNAGDPLARRARELTERAQALTRRAPGTERPGTERPGTGSGPPRGGVRMAELYEFWAQLTLARALGAEEGEVTRTPDGTGQGVLRGSVSGAPSPAPLTVELNPRLAFGGVGPASQNLQPDLSALLGAGSAAQLIVADMKYRPLDRLNSDAQREINDQLLRYMGVLHAPTGLILWPGLGAEDAGERCRVSVLPGGRARLVRLRLHPADPPGQLAADLRRLGLLGPLDPDPSQGAP